ncbi:TetR/AcrR family transcriptional regulator [Rhizobium leguminosarum]|jgi:AcrR family transcriptional regulator|uniref:TetR/AcrR family transcriptional regulator n=1 Tax=Rhizobium leguminosarum TaxID=384 RepID=UPI000DE46DF8|nr:TetR/AcrR family transcriptional regulator [Rhizobium leguminosarum]RWX28126.1 TetR/AcrR family transcriptional regulator [Rhizobium leguminosarum]
MTRTTNARPRNAAATREAILASARRAFAQSGYDGAGVRDIAAGAGVTAMLVNRYFGSKEKLFAEVIAATMAAPIILTAENLASAKLGEAIAASLVDITKAGDTPLEGFLIMLHSASSKRAAEIGREQIEAGHQKVMTGALSGDLAPQRAALILSIVAGFQVMRQMMGLSALADAEPEALVKLLAPVFQLLIEAEGADRPL